MPKIFGSPTKSSKEKIKKKSTAAPPWHAEIKETTVSSRSAEESLDIRLFGGSDYGQFCYIGPYLDAQKLLYHGGSDLKENDIIIEVQERQISGYTLIDVVKLLQYLSLNQFPVVLKTVAHENFPFSSNNDNDLKNFLSSCFPQDSHEYALQIVVKNNLNQRVVPCTTRPKRPDETNGVDYQFISDMEFVELDGSNLLLEKGMYEGNQYGTPKPSHDCSILLADIDGLASNRYSKADPNPRLGPLPDGWSIAETSDGKVYFVNSKNSITQWEDPRISMPATGSNEISAVVGEKEAIYINSSSKDLPPGWERVNDPLYGLFYVDHINKKTQFQPPETTDNNTLVNSHSSPDRFTPEMHDLYYPTFTRNLPELRGKLVRTELVKGTKGFGFTVVGGSDPSMPELLQIKNIVPDGPAAIDGVLSSGDVLALVNDTCVLGFTHSDVVNLFQKFHISEHVCLTVCQGYSLPYDPDDPDTQFITSVSRPEPSYSGLHYTINESHHSDTLTRISPATVLAAEAEQVGVEETRPFLKDASSKFYFSSRNGGNPIEFLKVNSMGRC